MTYPSSKVSSITRHCEHARVITRFTSRARSLSRLTADPKASYQVLEPVISAFRADIHPGFHEQCYRIACKENCELCQLADLSFKRSKVAARALVFMQGSLQVGGYPWLLTLTFPSYFPRREHIEDFYCPRQRLVFRSEYIRSESQKRYKSVVRCAKKWFSDPDINQALLRNSAGNLHYLAQDVPMKSCMDAMFEAKRLEQEAARSRARLTELHNQKTAEILNHVTPMSSEKEARFLAREMLSEEFKDVHDEEMVAERARHAYLKLRHVRQAHQDVVNEFRNAVIRELDGCSEVEESLFVYRSEDDQLVTVRKSDHPDSYGDLLALYGSHYEITEIRHQREEVPGTFEELWRSETFERGWLQAVFTVDPKKGSRKFRGRTCYMPDVVATSGRNYTDMEDRFPDWVNAGLELVLEDGQEPFRPTPRMGQAMFKKFRDRRLQEDGVTFSYYGVEESGVNSDNFHLHLLVHRSDTKRSAKVFQRKWARTWNAVSGNVIWKEKLFTVRKRDADGRVHKVSRPRVGKHNPGEGRWFEPVREPEKCAHYVAKYISKDGGRVRSAQNMFLAACVTDQYVIDNLLFPSGVGYASEEPEFESDGGKLRYKKRFTKEQLESCTGTEWIGFDVEPDHYRGAFARGPRVKLAWTARSSPARSVGSAKSVRVLLEDGTELQDGDTIPACTYRLPRRSFRSVPEGLHSYVVSSKLRLSRILQEMVTVGGENYREAYAVYRAMELDFEVSFGNVKYAAFPPASRSP